MCIYICRCILEQYTNLLCVSVCEKVVFSLSVCLSVYYKNMKKKILKTSDLIVDFARESFMMYRVVVFSRVVNFAKI